MKLSVIMGRYLRMLRRKSPHQQADMAGAVSVSTSTMSRVERNLTSLEVDYLEATLHALNVEILDFVVACKEVQTLLANLHISDELTPSDRRKIQAVHIDSAICNHAFYMNYQPTE